MQITNRTQAIYTWSVWNISDTVYWGSRGCEWIHPGQTHNQDVDSGGFQLYYLAGKFSAAGMQKFGSDSKEVRNGNAKILIQGDFAHGAGYVDWDPVEKKYIAGKDPSQPTKTSLSQGALVAASSIKAVSEFMKFVPGPGTVLSGLLAIAAGLADAIGRGSGTTSQLDAAEFLKAVKEIVRSASDRQTAEDAASIFADADAYLSTVDGGHLGPHELKDLRRNTEHFCAPGQAPKNALTSMNRHADKAKYITSAYLLGISAYLRFLWFHFLISLADGDKITASKLKAYKNDLEPCLEGLNALRTLATSDVKKTKDSTRVIAEPEATKLSEALYMSEIGLPDVKPLDSAIADVGNVLQMLDDDVQLVSSGQPAKHYFKKNWALG